MPTRRLSLMVAFAAAIVLGFSACGSDDSSAGDGSGSGSVSSTVPAEYRSSGEVTIATAVGNPPYASIEDGSTEPVGFDMDIIQALSEHLGLTPHIEVVQFPTIVPGLAAQRFDVAISSLTITPERTATIDMVSYIKIGTGLLVAADNPSDIHGMDDLCGKTVGVAKGSSNQEPVKAADAECPDGSNITMVEADGNDFVALQSGRVDALALDAAGAFAAAKADSDTFAAASSEVYGAGIAGIAFDKSNNGLAVAYQGALKDLMDDGTYQKLLDKWGISDVAIDAPEINPAG